MITATAVALAFAAAGPTVAVKDDYFSKTSLTVKKGTKVTWRWKGSAPHNVTVTKGPRKFRSSIKTSGTFRKKLRKRGTYRLVCTVHPTDMKMKIRVK